MKKLNFAKASCLLFGLCLALAIHAPAQTFTVLQNFPNSAPTAGLIQGLDGNFYSTLAGGEIGFQGNVYQMTPSGTYTVVLGFSGSSGDFPYAPLVLASNGFFYGSTAQGGPALEGNIYKMTANGRLTSLYSFCMTDCSDGSNPEVPLVQLGNGDLYGATNSTIFKITLAGTLTTLYNFCPGTTCTGGPPNPSGLTLGSDGNFYGVTSAGGTSKDGTVFKMTPSGTLTTLYTFSGTDGANPIGPLVQYSDGSLYGMTYSGGTGVSRACSAAGSCGTIFKITTAGALTTLHEFGGTDGANPNAGLILASDGNFYGTTGYGGNNPTNAGTAFVVSPTGALKTIYDFCSQAFCLDGGNPRTPLTQGTNGMLYGTAHEGGTQTNGTFFSLSRGLTPYVMTTPAVGNVGTKVIILGNNLTGTTAVTFHGAAAAFTVVSDTELTATVPTGATTGRVIVTTPSATLSTNVSFRVGH